MRLVRLFAIGTALGCLFGLLSFGSASAQSVEAAWVARYHSRGGEDRAQALALDRDGNVIVIGCSEQDIPLDDEYATVKYDPSGNKLWVARYHGPADFGDEANSVAVDTDGNIYVTGWSYGIGTGRDYATIKYDPNGNELWVARYNGAGGEFSQDFAYKVAVDVLGNVYVTGRSEEALEVSPNDDDMTTVKYDANGNELWVAHYNGPDSLDDAAYLIGVDGSGNVYVSGSVEGNGSYDDFMTIKYDQNGNELWVRQYGGLSNDSDVDRPGALALDPWGNILVTGESEGDYATIKYDPDGNELWVARYNGPESKSDEPNSMAVDAAGNVYVTGVIDTGINEDGSYGTIKYDPDGNLLWVARYDGPTDGEDIAYSLTLDGLSNVYITGKIRDGSSTHYASIKYDTDGNELWVARYEGSGGAVSIGVDETGNAHVTGTSSWDFVTIKYDPDGEELWLAWYDGADGVKKPGDEPVFLAVDAQGNSHVTGTTGRGDYAGDYLIVKYGSLGNELWVARYDGPRHLADKAHSMAVDTAGNVYVTGSSEGSDRNVDCVTVKYGPLGSQLWAARHNGPSQLSDQGYSVAVDDAGNVYVTGSSEGSATGLDYLTIKYDPSGNESWVRHYDGPGNGDDEAASLAVDSVGNVYVTGESQGDYATVKYDPDGNESWVARYDGPGSDLDQTCSIAVDAGGNVYVTGSSEGGATGLDYATIKYDPAGNESWVRRYDGPVNGEDAPSSLAVDSAGNAYVTGRSHGEDTWIDYATVKYDADGNELWVQRYNFLPHGWDGASSITVDDFSNAYVTGVSDGLLDKDYATIKYDSGGYQVWVKRYNYVTSIDDLLYSHDDEATCVAVDGLGNVYVTGKSYYEFATVKYVEGQAAEWSVDSSAQASTLGKDSIRRSSVLNYFFALSLALLTIGCWRVLSRRGLH